MGEKKHPSIFWVGENVSFFFRDGKSFDGKILMGRFEYEWKLVID